MERGISVNNGLDVLNDRAADNWRRSSQWSEQRSARCWESEA
jgi:hypothetical protein